MTYGAGPAFGLLIILFWVAATAVAIWALILWLVVGHRWLRLHPAPPRVAAFAAPSPAPAAEPGRPAPAPAAPAAPASAAELRAHFGPDLRAWASANEETSSLSARLGIGTAAASQLRAVAFRAAADAATEADWAQLRPWLPRILNRE
jgi:hypothetical protein